MDALYDLKFKLVGFVIVILGWQSQLTDTNSISEW